MWSPTALALSSIEWNSSKITKKFFSRSRFASFSAGWRIAVLLHLAIVGVELLERFGVLACDYHLVQLPLAGFEI